MIRRAGDVLYAIERTAQFRGRHGCRPRRCRSAAASWCCGSPCNSSETSSAWLPIATSIHCRRLPVLAKQRLLNSGGMPRHPRNTDHHGNDLLPGLAGSIACAAHRFDLLEPAFRAGVASQPDGCVILDRDRDDTSRGRDPDRGIGVRRIRCVRPGDCERQDHDRLALPDAAAGFAWHLHDRHDFNRRVDLRILLYAYPRHAGSGRLGTSLPFWFWRCRS